MTEKKQCFCNCHTWFLPETGCQVCFCGKKCCEQAGEKWPEWKTRLAPTEKTRITDELQEKGKNISSERDLTDWIGKMPIPEHLKKEISDEVLGFAMCCAQFNDVQELDVPGTVRWIIEDVLGRYL